MQEIMDRPAFSSLDHNGASFSIQPPNVSRGQEYASVIPGVYSDMDLIDLILCYVGSVAITVYWRNGSD